MSRRRYSAKEAFNRFLRSWQGESLNDEPETLPGQVLSENEALSDIAELFNNSLPSQTLTLPQSVKTAITNAGFASGTAIPLSIVSGTSTYVSPVSVISFQSGLSVSVTGSTAYVISGVGALQDWVPTITQSGTLSHTLSLAKYQRVENTVFVWMTATITQTGVAGNAIVIGNLPVPMATPNTNLIIGTGMVFDSGTAFYVGAARRHNSSSNLILLGHLETDSIGVDPSFALANNDLISIQLSYPV